MITRLDTRLPQSPCGWAGAIHKVTSSFGQEQLGQIPQKLEKSSVVDTADIHIMEERGAPLLGKARGMSENLGGETR